MRKPSQTRLVSCALILFCLACGESTVGTNPDGGAPDTGTTADAGTLDSGAGASDASFTPREIPDLSRWVRPIVGTQGSGNTFPGPCLPHGMVKLGPDTHVEAGNLVGYEYDDARIEGFSHTQLDGPGGSSYGYSHVLLMPATGEVKTEEEDYASTFSHETEVAELGYYAVTLDDYGVRAELTTTHHGGFHRYTFPASDTSHVLIDIGHSRGASRDGRVEIAGATVKGFGVYSVHPLLTNLLDGWAPGTTGIATVYFAARFSKAPKAFGTWNETEKSPGAAAADGKLIGAWLEFDTTEGEVIEARVGISYISVEEAERHIDDELVGRSFDDVRKAAVDAWNRLLSRVEVEGGTDDDRTRFYTALYHSLLQPADYTENGRFWIGAGGKGAVRDADGRRYFTDNWCLWDTAKTTHPLLTLIEPEVAGDMVQSMVWNYEEQGWISKCTWNATGDSRIMTGNHAFCVIADAWAKDLRDFDAKKAYEAMKKGSLEDSRNPMEEGLCGYLGQGTPPQYIELGYVPKECDSMQAASMTLEHAYNDWCVSVLASGLGKTADAPAFLARSGNWKNVWNPAHGFMQMKKKDGSWDEPFDPEKMDLGFTEANAWIYTWHVQHDVCGLIAAMGGGDAFVAKLDAFFDEGHFDMSNEPDFHAPWLYNRAGAPSKTSGRVRSLMQSHFTTGPGGLPGNDDAGATSAWFVFATMGLYPVAPGNAKYDLNVPLFDKVTIHFEPDIAGGRDFIIEAPGASEGKLNIASAAMNGKPLDLPQITHADVVAGGKLVLELSSEPTDWGGDAKCGE
jgi:predicted alpha-1,2-mannosidase